MKPILLLLCVGFAAALECTQPNEIACRGEERCIPLNYICDGGNDCQDGLDEDTQLCAAWNKNNCERGETACTIDGTTSCVTIQDFCQRDNPKCSGELDRRICKIIEDKELNLLEFIKIKPDFDPETAYNLSLSLGEELERNINTTISHTGCPRFYTRVAGQCVSLFYVGRSSWGEARAFCNQLGGDLLVINNVTHYTRIVDHLRKNQITSDFWIGGNYKNNNWLWVDGSRMTMGTPFWTVRRYDSCNTRNVTVPGSPTRTANNGECYHFRQAPENPPLGFCASMTYDKYFYISDEDCLGLKSPLCEF